jgi:transposase
MSPLTKVEMSPLRQDKIVPERDKKVDELQIMSGKEINKLGIMQQLKDKRLRQREAAEMLGVSVRQVKRLYKGYQEKGAGGLVSKRRGQESNHRLKADVVAKVLELVKEKYKGFGPTLAHEKLVEMDHLKISTESVRKIMIVEGIWKSRQVRKIVTHQMRERRACYGELVQIDGSPHDWFEGRADKCTLLVFIDDATGRLLQLLFVKSESFFSYCAAAKGYFERCGKPIAFYSDKHGIFRVNIPSREKGDNLTQFGRAMKELDIEIICANTPQAKGRVERANQTLQDRLVKEMGLRGISSMAEGNAYLFEFIADFNHRFAVEPRSSHDAHRPINPQDNLNQILTWQETRSLSKNLTVQFEKVVYQIQTDRPTYALRGAHVTVCQDISGRVSILYKNSPLEYTVFHQQPKQSEVVSSKEIDLALQSKPMPHKPAPDHPWRNQPLNPKKVTSLLCQKGDISTLR